MEKSVLIALLFIPIALVGLVLSIQGTVTGSQRFMADALAALGPAASSTAVTADATTTPTLTDVLRQLQLQEVFLTRELASVEVKLKRMASTTRELRRGESGDDVVALQALLVRLGVASTTASTTPTGYFGKATEQAVQAFQASQGLKASGVVDAATRAAFSSMQPDGASQTFDFTPIDLAGVPALETSGTLAWMQGQISQLELDSGNAQSSLSDLQGQVSGLSSQVSDLQASVSSAPIPAGPTTPPALAISNVAVATTTKSSATITWTTTNPATSIVNYSTSSSLSPSQTKSITNTSMVTSHSATLPSLISATTYYYQVSSTDSYGATATSTTASFTTAHS